MAGAHLKTLVGWSKTLVARRCSSAAIASAAYMFCCILWSRSESGTGHSCPLDGSADTMGGWGYLLGS